MQVTVFGPAHISSVGARVKTADGKEGDADYACLSKTPLAVSFVPKSGATNDPPTVKAFLRATYEAARALDVEHLQILEKRKFAHPTVNTPEELDLTARSTVADFYAKMLHKFVYGSNMAPSSVLSIQENAWLKAWPSIVAQTYADGLKGADKGGAEPAVQSLELRGSLKGMGEELAGVGDDDKEKRQKLEDRMKEWQAKIDDTEKRVRF